MMDMMNFLNGSGSTGTWAVFAVILFITFWAGIFLLAVYIVSTAKEDKFKTYLLAGLALIIGSVFITSLLNGSVMKGFFGFDMQKRDFKQMIQDEDVKKEFKKMMSTPEDNPEDTQ